MKKNDIDNAELKKVASEAAIGIANHIKAHPEMWEGGPNEDDTISLYNHKIGIVMYDKEDGTFTITSNQNRAFPIFTSKSKGDEGVILTLDSAFSYFMEYNYKKTAIGIKERLEKA